MNNDLPPGPWKAIRNRDDLSIEHKALLGFADVYDRPILVARGRFHVVLEASPEVVRAIELLPLLVVVEKAARGVFFGEPSSILRDALTQLDDERSKHA